MIEADVSPTEDAEALIEAHRVWLLSWAYSLVIPVIMVGMHLFAGLHPALPAIGSYSLLAGIVLIVPSIPLLWRFRRMNRSIASQGASTAASAGTLRRQMMIGITVADFPALAGILHYFLTHNIVEGAALCVVTVIVIYLYRPAARNG